ncbi:uncharacterized protein BXZ73DRAFT_99150 [Epithele typhae]|uniref:uncharacterized protein n=1 Tax=Epithele typhae TaxID=378194 RepID=UPI002007C883|nr:uncharacterized protein BXZ73DRAFT_99150 [Epithele typhae]KAH9940154.1 hypothetical protein BXZ73DRAFT_99150 [Epithele typhae]
MGMTEDDEEQEPNSFRQPATTLRPTSPSPRASAPAIPDELTDRLNALSKQLEMALELSRSLEAQHATAQSTISVLESKVASLENLVQDTQTQVQSQVEVTEQLVQAYESARAAPQEPTVPVAAVEEARKEERELLTSIFAEWKNNVKGKWSSVHEDWTEERERLWRARDEWESRMCAAEETVSTAVTKVDNGLMSLTSFQAHQQQKFMNGNAKPHSSGGIVTPPSPRSLSAESTRPRNRRKRTASRGRTRTRIIFPSPTDDGTDNLVSLDGTHQSESGDIPGSSSITPESSVVNQPISAAIPGTSAATDARPPPSAKASVVEWDMGASGNVRVSSKSGITFDQAYRSVLKKDGLTTSLRPTSLENVDKKLELSLSRALNQLQRSSSVKSRTHKPEELHEERREREIHELRRWRGLDVDDGVLRELEGSNMALGEELKNARELLENTGGLERMRELPESRGGHSSQGDLRW